MNEQCLLTKKRKRGEYDCGDYDDDDDDDGVDDDADYADNINGVGEKK